MSKVKLCSSLMLLLLSTANAQTNETKNQSIWRLFTTPEERNQLDQAREQFLQNMDNSGDSVSSLGQLIAPGIKVNGLIIRKNGKNEIWVNNKNSNSQDAAGRDLRDHVAISRRNKVQIQLPEGGEVSLLPGQIYYPSNKQTKEGYQAPDLLVNTNESEEQEVDKVAQADDKQAVPAPEKDNTQPVFDETALAEQVSKIELLENRIKALEKQQKSKVIRR